MIIVVRERLRAGGAFRTAEILVLSLSFWLPFLIAALTPFPLSAVVLGSLLALIASQPGRAPDLEAAPARGM